MYSRGLSYLLKAVALLVVVIVVCTFRVLQSCATGTSTLRSNFVHSCRRHSINNRHPLLRIGHHQQVFLVHTCLVQAIQPSCTSTLRSILLHSWCRHFGNRHPLLSIVLPQSEDLAESKSWRQTGMLRGSTTSSSSPMYLSPC